jgi:hypothetical protein
VDGTNQVRPAVGVQIVAMDGEQQHEDSRREVKLEVRTSPRSFARHSDRLMMKIVGEATAGSGRDDGKSINVDDDEQWIYRGSWSIES